MRNLRRVQTDDLTNVTCQSCESVLINGVLVASLLETTVSA